MQKLTPVVAHVLTKLARKNRGKNLLKQLSVAKMDFPTHFGVTQAFAVGWSVTAVKLLVNGRGL